MAKVTVVLFSTVREAAGRSNIRMEASDLGELILSLKRLGPEVAKLLRGFERDPDGLVILVNGANVGRAPPDSVKLGNDDEVSIFPPVSGG